LIRAPEVIHFGTSDLTSGLTNLDPNRPLCQKESPTEKLPFVLLTWPKVKEKISMLLKLKSLIKNLTRVLVLLAGIILKFLANLVDKITAPLGIGVQLVNAVICVCILVIGILPVLKFFGYYRPH